MVCVTQQEDQSINSPLLEKYLPSERRAICVHCWYLGIERGCDPGLEAAIRSWEERYAPPWRHKKMHRDMTAQLHEIEQHRAHLARVRGSDVPWDEAFKDWTLNHAAAWRNSWEMTPAAGA